MTGRVSPAERVAAVAGAGCAGSSAGAADTAGTAGLVPGDWTQPAEKIMAVVNSRKIAMILFILEGFLMRIQYLFPLLMQKGEEHEPGA
jgi:hypothetical protein